MHRLASKIRVRPIKSKLSKPLVYHFGVIPQGLENFRTQLNWNKSRLSPDICYKLCYFDSVYWLLTKLRGTVYSEIWKRQ
jgi:hypothetical protein